jgi:hypothetical protein
VLASVHDTDGAERLFETALDGKAHLPSYFAARDRNARQGGRSEIALEGVVVGAEQGDVFRYSETETPGVAREDAAWRAVTDAVPLIDEFRFGSAYSSRTGRTEPT